MDVCSNLPNKLKFVIPAKAGIQSVKFHLRNCFKHWIPAFAGMTA
jgi:hypothetical protein